MISLTKIKKILAAIVITAGTPNPLLAQTNYATSSIPQELKVGAYAVVRKQITSFEVVSEKSATINETYAVTILHENALKLGYFREFYDNFSKISRVSGALYDKDGKEIKTFGKKDILDVSAVGDGSTMYSDSRAKVITTSHTEYPYTVEFQYTKSLSAYLDFPDWRAYPNEEVSVEYSSMEIVSPKHLPVRFIEKNLSQKGTVTELGNKTLYRWEAKGLKAIPAESYAAPIGDYTPMVLIAPLKFSMDGYEGSYETWQTYGNWINQLNVGRNKLSIETQAKVVEMTSKAATPAEKVEILYKYMQDKVRYISIQVGIGGFQPFEADFVDQKSYGDCKALTNYMRSMLQVVGIESVYTLVEAGDDAKQMVTDFPSSQFNHVFLTVPIEKDTLWLECTSQQSPIDYLSDFTDDRCVLLVEGNDSKVVKTPANKENLQKRKITVDLTPEGGMKAKIETCYTGALYGDFSSLLGLDDVSKKKSVLSRINLPSSTLDKFDFYEEKKGAASSFTEKVDLTNWSYATKMGARYILPVNMLSKVAVLTGSSEDRVSPVHLSRSITTIDTIEYTLPEGYAASFEEERDTFSSQFGEYSYSVKSVGNKVIYQRHFTLKKGTYPTASYAAFKEFFQKIEKADSKKVVLKAKE